MITPISFGSAYKTYTPLCDSEQISKQEDLITFNEKNGFEYDRTFKTPTSFSPEVAVLTSVVPDKLDADFESFCANKGIKYKKYKFSDILTSQTILSRIDNPPKGYKKALVDVDKLEEFLKNQTDNNFEHCEKDYNQYYKNRTNFMLKSKDNIPAPTLYILPSMGNRYALEYIRNFGRDKLNPNSIITDLSQRTSDPDHCLYFAMRDAGLKQIPVYVNNDTYEIGCALGLLK